MLMCAEVVGTITTKFFACRTKMEQSTTSKHNFQGTPFLYHFGGTDQVQRRMVAWRRPDQDDRLPRLPTSKFRGVAFSMC